MLPLPLKIGSNYKLIVIRATSDQKFANCQNFLSIAVKHSPKANHRLDGAKKNPVNNGINYQPQPVICIPGLVAAARALAAGAPLSLPLTTVKQFSLGWFLISKNTQFFWWFVILGLIFFSDFCVFIRYVEGKKTKILAWVTFGATSVVCAFNVVYQNKCHHLLSTTNLKWHGRFCRTFNWFLKFCFQPGNYSTHQRLKQMFPRSLLTQPFHPSRSLLPLRDCKRIVAQLQTLERPCSERTTTLHF